MKRFFIFTFALLSAVMLVACGGSCSKPIQLMGAGDKIHDTYTFANVGTKIKDNGKNTYTIYGSVDKLEDIVVKEEFEIAENVTHIIAIKLCAQDVKVVKDEVEIYVNGTENYDAEHLNGSTFTYILLEAKANLTVNISVKWNKDAEIINYVLYFAEDLELK